MGHHRHNAENLRLRNFRRENPPQALKKGLPQMAELVYRPVIGAARTMFKALDLKIDTQGSEHIPKTGGAVLVSNHISYLDFIFTASGPFRRSGSSGSWRRNRSSGTRSPVR